MPAVLAGGQITRESPLRLDPRGVEGGKRQEVHQLEVLHVGGRQRVLDPVGDEVAGDDLGVAVGVGVELGAPGGVAVDGVDALGEGAGGDLDGGEAGVVLRGAADGEVGHVQQVAADGDVVGEAVALVDGGVVAAGVAVVLADDGAEDDAAGRGAAVEAAVGGSAAGAAGGDPAAEEVAVAAAEGQLVGDVEGDGGGAVGVLGGRVVGRVEGDGRHDVAVLDELQRRDEDFVRVGRVEPEVLPVAEDVLDHDGTEGEEVADLEVNRVLELVAGGVAVAAGVVDVGDGLLDGDGLLAEGVVDGGGVAGDEDGRLVAGVDRLPLRLDRGVVGGRRVVAGDGVVSGGAGRVVDRHEHVERDGRGRRVGPGPEDGVVQPHDQVVVRGGVRAAGGRRLQHREVGRAVDGEVAGVLEAVRQQVREGQVADGLAGGEERLDAVLPHEVGAGGGLVLGADVDLPHLDQLRPHGGLDDPRVAVGLRVAEDAGVGGRVVQRVGPVPEAGPRGDLQLRLRGAGVVGVREVAQLRGDVDVQLRLSGRERAERQLHDDQLVARPARHLKRVAGGVDGVRVVDGAGAGAAVRERQRRHAEGRPEVGRAGDGEAVGGVGAVRAVGPVAGDQQVDERAVAGVPGGAGVLERRGEGEGFADEGLAREVQRDLRPRGQQVRVGGPGLLAEGDRRLQRADQVFQVPVPAANGGAGGVVAGGHVRAGEDAEGLQQRAAVLAGGEVAAQQQQVAARGQRVAPLRDLRGVPAEVLLREPDAAEVQAPLVAVADDVQGVQPLAPA